MKLKMVKKVEYLYETRYQGLMTKRILIRVSKEKGLYGEYQNNEGDDRCFYLNNEDFGIPPPDKLLEEIGKIYFPKNTNFFDKRIMEKTPWHLTIDKTEYFGNSEPEFYTKIYEMLNIKEIEKFISRKIGQIYIGE